MQFFADGALEKAGAEDGSERHISQEVVEESIYMLELPTLGEDASVSAAIDLGLRQDPSDATNKSRPFGASACLKELGGEDNEQLDAACVAYCMHKTSLDIFPPLTWFPALTFARVKGDVIAALTVGVMAVPQSMSYASIAGLDLVYGLYAAAVPTLIYGFLGGSGQLAVGPVALVSLIVEEGLRSSLSRSECPEFFEDDGESASSTRRFLVEDTLASTCPDEYARLVHVCMFFVGMLQLGGSIARLGFLVNFLGHPVVSGFTSGAAIVIGMSQVKSWLGVSVPKSQYAYETIADLVGKVARGEAKPMPFVLGLVSYFALWLVRKASQKYPKRFGWLRPLGPLLVCVAALILMICTPTLRDDWHVEVVGLIPSGLPPATIGTVLRRFTSDASRVLPTAASAALVGLLESIAIGKSLAAKHGDDLSSTREMRAVGSANLIGSLFSGYPVAGSFSRSAVANNIGARTPLAGLVTSLFLFMTLVFLPKFARKLPRFVLASIVISSVVNLVAIDEARWLWRVRKADFCLWFLAFAGVLFIGILYGLAIAVVVSLIIVLYESVRPQIAVLWKLPGTMVYRNVKQGETNGQFVDGVLVVRVGSSMYFFNVAYIKDSVLDLARRFDKAMKQTGHVSADESDLGSVGYVVIEMTPVQSLDSTAIHMLEDLAKDLKRRGVHMCLASCGSRVEETFRRAGVQKHIGYEWFHSNVNSAVEFCVRHRAATEALRADAHLLTSYRRVDDQTAPADVDSPSTGDGAGEDIELTQLAGKSLVRRSSRTEDAGDNVVSTANAANVASNEGGVLSSFFGGFRSGPADNVSNDKKSDGAVDKKDPRVLMLASKHRVINRDISFSLSENELLVPERRALDAIAAEVEQKRKEAQDHEHPSAHMNPDSSTLNDKRQFLATRRAVVKRSSTSSSTGEIIAPIHETLAPARVVAVPDESAPDLMLFLAVDVADRPGLLRDISDVLLRQLTLQVRFSEAAVVGQRSISIWRCEILDRGRENVAAAANKAEIAVVQCLTHNLPA
mmetsp:Transcript_19682/g.61930  ORF Transcript_19682/g.61930 Transcript_19682/m.61930 type:complete len:1020 (+) Transcript_19682:100-3159(+)